MDARRIAVLVATVAVVMTTAGPANARNDNFAAPDKNGFIITGQTTREHSRELSRRSASEDPVSPTPARSQVRFEYRTACDTGAYQNVTGAPTCLADPCEAGSTQYRQWAVTATSEQPMGFVCAGGEPPPATGAPPAVPQVTDAMVLEAFRRIPVPELRSVAQPADKTLVNFETLFYAEADGFSRTVTLLGQQVRLEIEPSSFQWRFGDGTSATTATAGAPYPRKDIVHRYADAGVTVSHRVVVTWSARWSLNGGPLQPVVGTVTTTGPLTPLRVAEAVPALSGRR